MAGLIEHAHVEAEARALDTAQHADLERLKLAARHRSLIDRAGIDCSSNDYLGLAGSAFLADAARAAIDRGVAIGSGGSRLLRGNDPEHQALEAEYDF